MAFLKSGIMKCNLLKNGGLSLVRWSRGLADKSVASEKINSMSTQELLKNTVRPSGFNKVILVWTGRYKNTAEIPESVSFETMQKARNKMRIKLSNYMMAATVVACIGMVIAGKKAAVAGETITKMNMDWHKEYNEKAKAEAEAKKIETK